MSLINDVFIKTLLRLNLILLTVRVVVSMIKAGGSNPVFFFLYTFTDQQKPHLRFKGRTCNIICLSYY